MISQWWTAGWSPDRSPERWSQAFWIFATWIGMDGEMDCEMDCEMDGLPLFAISKSICIYIYIHFAGGNYTIWQGLCQSDGWLTTVYLLLLTHDKLCESMHRIPKPKLNFIRCRSKVQRSKLCQRLCWWPCWWLKIKLRSWWPRFHSAATCRGPSKVEGGVGQTQGQDQSAAEKLRLARTAVGGPLSPGHPMGAVSNFDQLCRATGSMFPGKCCSDDHWRGRPWPWPPADGASLVCRALPQGKRRNFRRIKKRSSGKLGACAPPRPWKVWKANG